MDGLPFPTTASTINTSIARPLLSFATTRERTRNLSFLRKPKFLVFASKDDPKLDQWDQMELKFGRLLGEDPKLTLAKIMGRKSNPDMSYLEIEKAFNKKGKILDGVEEVSFDGSNTKEGQSLNSSNGLNLVRPVPKKGVKFESNYNPVVSEAKKPSQPVGKNVDNSKSSIPNVILRRPSTLGDDDVETGKSSKLRIKPNLSLRMGKEQTRKFSDITLLKKPELTNINPNNTDQRSFGDMKAKVYDDVEETTLEIGSLSTETTSNATLFDQPERMNLDSNIDQGKEFSADLIGSNSHKDLKENSLKVIDGSDDTVNTTKINFEESPEATDASVSVDPLLDSQSATGLQPLEQSVKGSDDKETSINEPPEKKMVGSGVQFYMEAALQGKPKRFDQSVKEASSIGRETTVAVNPENYGNSDELENFLATSPLKEHEDTDWKRAENLVRAGGREEVELISSSTRGFVVSFGSLIGFLPYRNLAARWKFLAFESWLRRKGLDPSVYKQNLGIIGSFEITNKSSSLDPSLIPETDHEVEAEISPDMKLEDLLRIYDQEKLKFLSSFVGQKIKVNVVFADRKSRRLIFSVKPKEKEELVEKKRSLMAKLSVGDVVKCCIKKITYFGIFVEVDGVPALIHQTEVSWDATLDPATYFKIGQIVEAKVHQLDFSLERIFLSLKEITPDPLSETLEAVIGDNDSLVGTMEAAEADTEWAEVESIIEELQRIEGIQYVSKGRFFLSPGLAPTFQVYMASMFENQYKLLARSGNKIQEVIVQTSLGKEEMKSAILTCTNRVV